MGDDRHPFEETTDDYAFGPFTLSGHRRILLCDGQILPLKGRTFDLLLLLVENAGRFLSNAELVAKVWHNSQAKESNLRVQIGNLRRILADQDKTTSYIINVTGRGYSFRAPLVAVQGVTPPRPPRPAHVAPASNTRLPTRLKRTIGRAREIRELHSLVTQYRLTTVVGPAGSGKTMTSITLAETIGPAFADGVYFVDLASLDKAEQLLETVATALGHTIRLANASDIAGPLTDRNLLLLMDNCEHLILPVADFVENLLARAHAVHVLATSREPIRIDGERVFRLGPLEMPKSHLTVSAQEALEYPAVQLFIDRVRAVDNQVVLSDRDILRILDICRQLDGNCLAVELAAARAPLFGIEGLAARLEQNLSVLTSGRRTALARHRTVRAALDWSYETLTPDEQEVLQCLSVFRSDFCMLSVRSVIAGAQISVDALTSIVGDLVAKSLIAVDMMEGMPRYRLLFVTRNYAFEKLAEAGRVEIVSRRHAQRILQILSEADLFRSPREKARDHDLVARMIDDVRAAIDWALSTSDDVLLGVRITEASADLGGRLSLTVEFRRRIELALTHLAGLNHPDPLLEMKLLLQRANFIIHTAFDAHSWAETTERISALVELSSDRKDTIAFLVQETSMIAARHFTEGNSPELLRACRQAVTFSQSLPEDHFERIVANRALAQALHFEAQHDDALVCIDDTLRHPAMPQYSEATFPGRCPDPRITLRIFSARTHWIQGRAELATATICEALDMAAGEFAHVYCYAVSFAAVPIALWRGDLAQARYLNNAQMSVAANHQLVMWSEWSAGFGAVLDALEHDMAEPDAPLLTAGATTALLSDVLATVHPRLVNAEADKRVDDGLVAWSAPEILRARGLKCLQDMERLRGTPRREQLLTGIDWLQKSHALATDQRAFAFTLRSATSLGEAWLAHRVGKNPVAVVEAALATISEGHADIDHRRASAILDLLASATPYSRS